MSNKPLDDEFDPDDETLTRFDLVREGARRDGVEIVHYAPRFPVHGTKEEKRIERTMALLLVLSGLAGLAFVVIYIAWPLIFGQGYHGGWNASKWYTPLLGTTLGLALLGIGMTVVIWAKKLLPEEVSVQDRHDGPSDAVERKLTGQRILHTIDETGITRRPLLKGALLVGAAPLGLAAVVPLGALVVSPKNDLFETGFNPKKNGGKPVRLVREDGTPVKPEEISVGGQITVFPGIPGGTTNKYADSPTLLLHLREPDARIAEKNADKAPWNKPNGKLSQWHNFIAYSKICSHAGCPASLYEQQTNRLLCPCHQSQFQITDNARPIFGPATRSLSQLPIEVDSEGFFIATGDFNQPIGPGFWERP